MTSRAASRVAREAVLGLSALRARQWLHFVPLPLAGTPASGLLTGACPLVHVLWACVSGALCLAYAYGLNAYCDRASDGPGPKNPLAGARVGAGALVPAGLCAPLAVWAAGRSGGAFAALLSLAAATLYSAGPRLKRRPALGTLVNAAIFAPLLALVGEPRPPGFWAMLAVFAALLLQNQLLHERADAAEDRRAGARTTARLLGAAGVRRAGRGLALAGALAALPGSGWASWAAGAAGLVAGAWCMGHGAPDMARRRHRRLAVAAGAAMYALAQGGAG